MGFTAKQQAFINEYLICRNATQAAIEAGYSKKTARSIGSENLTKPDILAEIQQRTADAAMKADEVIARLSDHARATMDDFIEVKPGVKHDIYFDFEKAAKLGKLHLIKKIGHNSQGQVSIELQDQQSALIQLGRLHGLFTDKTIIDDTGLSDEERANRIAAIFDAARARRDRSHSGDGDN